MKLLLLFLLSMAATLQAQQVVTEDLPVQDSGTDLDEIGRLQLIPETPTFSTRNDFGPPDPPARRSVSTRSKVRRGPTETEKAVQEQKSRVSMRQARIRAEKDPGVVAAYEQARNAKTDAERRYAMELYYNRLCDKMLAADPSLKAPVEKLRERSISPLEQKEIRGSEWSPGE